MIIHRKEKKGLDLVTSFFLSERRGKMEGSEAMLQEKLLMIEVNQGWALKWKMSS